MDKWRRFHDRQQSNFRADLAKFHEQIMKRQDRLAKIMGIRKKTTEDAQYRYNDVAERRSNAYTRYKQGW